MWRLEQVSGVFKIVCSTCKYLSLIVEKCYLRVDSHVFEFLQPLFEAEIGYDTFQNGSLFSLWYRTVEKVFLIGELLTVSVAGHFVPQS